MYHPFIENAVGGDVLYTDTFPVCYPQIPSRPSYISKLVQQQLLSFVTSDAKS